MNHAAYLGSRRKRALDLIAGGCALLVAGPLLAAAVVAIRLETHGHPVYRQRRVGRDGRPFELYKLRTMVSGAENMGKGLAVDEGDDRITRLGAWLRRTSLDEVPNLVAGRDRPAADGRWLDKTRPGDGASLCRVARSGPEDVAARKPDPAGLLQLMGELHADAGETALVGDSPVDVETGRAAKVFTVGVRYGFDPEGVAAASPDALLDDLRGLPAVLLAGSASLSGDLPPE